MHLDILMVWKLKIKIIKIPFAPSATVSPINLALYLKDLKAPAFSIWALKLVASSL